MSGLSVERVAVLGGNGTMGTGVAAIFAARSIPTTLLCRSFDSAQDAQQRVVKQLRSNAVGRFLTPASYAEGFAKAIGQASLVVEALPESAAIKRNYYVDVDRERRPGSVVVSVTSGLSIAGLASERSADFCRHFLGAHFFNPPTLLAACELVTHAGTAASVATEFECFLRGRLNREVLRVSDTPAFLGNRVGFHFLNQAAALSELHGVERIDMLLGGHIGRAMEPLRTIDFVGLDVHLAITDHLYEQTRDEAHGVFAAPAFMRRCVEAGQLGRKTPERGGFYRRVGERTLALQPASLTYLDVQRPVARPEIVERMRQLHRVGRHQAAFDALCKDTSPEAKLMLSLLLEHIAYAFNRVPEVTQTIEDVDRVLANGFNWIPVTALVLLFGGEALLNLMRGHGVTPPAQMSEWLERHRNRRLPVDIGRYFFV